MSSSFALINFCTYICVHSYIFSTLHQFWLPSVYEMSFGRTSCNGCNLEMLDAHYVVHFVWLIRWGKNVLAFSRFSMIIKSLSFGNRIKLTPWRLYEELTPWGYDKERSSSLCDRMKTSPLGDHTKSSSVGDWTKSSSLGDRTKSLPLDNWTKSSPLGNQLKLKEEQLTNLFMDIFTGAQGWSLQQKLWLEGIQRGGGEDIDLHLTCISNFVG